MAPAILSQSEIDALLSSLPAEEATPQPIVAQTKEERDVKPYDFRHPDKFSRDQLRTLEMIHDGFARRLSTDLSTFLRSVAVVNMLSVVQENYDDFVRTVPVPAVLYVIGMDPLPGVAAVELHPNVAFIIIDRLLGGVGRGLSKMRELSEVEHNLLHPIIADILSTLKAAWAQITTLDPAVQQTASTPQFLHIAYARDIVVTVTFEFRVMDSMSRMRICMPYVMLEPIVQQLTAQARFSVNRRTLGADQAYHLRRNLSKVNVPVSAVLGETQVTVGDLLRLEKGDFIRLDATTNRDLDVMVAGEVRFRAKPGLSGRRLAMMISEVLEREDNPNDE
jgi:flagellar motor switch protein FliM